MEWQIMEKITERQAKERFDEMLDELHEEPVICGISFYPSTILKECDPIAYRCYFNDWVSEMEDEFEVEYE